MLSPRLAPPRYLPLLLVAYGISAMVVTDLYLPSMPLLARVFDTTDAQVQWTLTIYMGGFAGAQLIYGPLSDRFGRRPVLLWGGVAFLAATLLCGTARSIETLILARLAQGVAIASLFVTSKALIRELYDDATVVRVTAQISMVESLAPALGPIIGAEILTLLGWRWNFFSVAILASATLAALFLVLPESNQRLNRDALRIGPILATYAQLLRMRRFMAYVLPAGMIFGGLMVYLTSGSFLLIEERGLTPRQFAFAQGFTVACYFAGLMTTSRIVGRSGSLPLIRGGLIAVFLGGGAMATLGLAGIETAWAVIAPFAVFAFGIGLSVPPMMTMALSADSALVGALASLLGAIVMSCAFAGSLLANLIYDGTALSVAIPLGVMSTGAFLIYAGLAPRPDTASRPSEA